MMKEAESNKGTPLQQFLAKTIVASNRDVEITLVSDTAKTKSPKWYGRRNNPFSSISDSSVTSNSPNKKTNFIELCRWGETSSLQGDPSPPEATPSMRNRTLSDDDVIVPTSDVNKSSVDDNFHHNKNGKTESDKILRTKEDSRCSIAEKYNSVCSPSREARTKLISRTSTKVKEERAIQSGLKPKSTTATAKPEITRNHQQKVARKTKNGQSSPSKVVNRKGSLIFEATISSTMEVEKGQAIIEKVIELSRKAALAMTQDEANTRRTVRSATSA